MAVATRAVFTGAVPDAWPRVFDLTTAPDGGWNQVIEPRAIHHDGVTFFVFIDGDDGHIKVAKYTHATKTLSSPVTLATAPGPTVVDLHNAPVILRRVSDARLVVAWAGHSSSSVFRRISTNPAPDISAWDSATDLDTSIGGTAYTYPNLLQLGDVVDDPIYLILRDNIALPGVDADLIYSTSTDGGSTWSAKTVLVRSAEQAYWVVHSDGGSRIDIAYADGHPPTAPGAVPMYHFYIEGGKRYQTDGTEITKALPLAPSDLTLVDSGTDPVWPMGITRDGSGHPVFVYTTQDAADYRRARWTGSAWDKRIIVAAGAQLGPNPVTPHVVIDHADPDRVFAIVLRGDDLEVRRFTTQDQGESWQEGIVTKDSGVTNLYPAMVHGHTPELAVLWLAGTFTSATDNSMAVRGGR